jgi:DNA polymerase-3 subunit gamma/tau
MLSTSAFNALLKTLEEPPAHVKFIFATTEIRKVPVTVLSRCQRFDLRRIEPEVMIALMRKIATSEGAEIADDALALITRAAEGSARDATSLLDQAISHGAGETTADQVRAMLGLADRGRVLDLYDMILRGDAGGALNELSAQYADGADPMAVLRDLAEITHWVSVVKISPESAADPTISPDERARGQAMAEKLPMRVMTRMWQMLLKALEEVAAAPNAMMAAEMAIIRLTHVADLPSPEELGKKLQDTPPPPGPPGGGGGGMAPQMGGATQAYSQAQVAGGPGGTVTALAPQAEQALARFASFDHVVDLIQKNRDGLLLNNVKKYVRLASYQPGRIEFVPAPNAPHDLAQRLGTALQRWTGNRWAVILVNEGGAPSIFEVEDAENQALRDEARAHPLVQAVFDAFPKAKITDIKTQQEIAQEAQAEALPEVEDEWDPFEEG